MGDPRIARRRTWRATGGGGGDARRIDKSCEERARASTFLVCFLHLAPPTPLPPHLVFVLVSFCFLFLQAWICAEETTSAGPSKARSFDATSKDLSLLIFSFSFLRRAQRKKGREGGGTKSIVLRNGAVVALRVLLLKTEHTTQN